MSDVVLVAPEWLALREGADARTRASDLAAEAARRMPSGPLAIHDLGSGTGAMMRWLAPRLPGPQTWTLHDWNPVLLAVATPVRDAAGREVAVSTAVGDLALLTGADIAGASLVTASALLDVLTEDELTGIVGACVASRTPALLSLSVSGVVRLDPVDPADGVFGAAFNEHQRRTADGRRLLGPDAGARADALFRAAGWEVRAARTPWRLDASEAGLLAGWLDGWVAAAVEQRPALREWADEYLPRLAAQLARGALAATIDHVDVLAWPR